MIIGKIRARHSPLNLYIIFYLPFLCLAVVIARVHAMVAAIWSTPGQVREFVAVLGIRMFLSLPDPDPFACKIKSYNDCKIRSSQKILEKNGFLRLKIMCPAGKL